MKKVILLVLVTFLLSSCGGIQIGEEKLEEETGEYKMNAVTAVINGLDDEQFQIEINEKIKNYNDTLIASFRERITTDDNTVDELKITPMIYRGKRTISIVNDVYEYNGGSHGIMSRPDITIDTAENRLLELEDLFVDDKWLTFLNSKLAEMVEADSEKYSVLWEKPQIMDDQSFYIDGVNLVIYYPPYELSYYARGFVDFKIPTEQLVGYIKPVYIGAEQQTSQG